MVSRYTGAFSPRPRAAEPTATTARGIGTFQDLAVEARYQATTGALAVTPFVAVGLPVAGYEILAHAAAGKGICARRRPGVYVGRRLDPILPEAYAQARLSFTVPERVLGVWHNRNNANLELGYFVRPGARRCA